MSVERVEIERIATLARLRLEEADAERMTRELNGILEHVEVLRGVVGSDVDEGDVPTEGVRATRASEEGSPDPLGTGLDSIAPRFVDGFFTVPPPPGVHAEEGDE